MDNGKGQEKQPEAVAVNSQENIQDNERAVGMQSRMQSKGYQSGWIPHQNHPTYH